MVRTYPLLVQDFLEHSARRVPDKDALVCGASKWTYGQLDAMADRLAQTLVADGLERGARVVIHLGNGVEAVVSIFAVLKANAVFVCVNRTTRPDKLNHILRHCRASVLITEARTVSGTVDGARVLEDSAVAGLVLVDGPESLSAAAGRPARSWESVQALPSCGPVPRRAIDLDLACLIYTSGTTGNPKGVMCAHENMVFAARAISSYLVNSRDDRVLSVLQLSFTYGLYQLLVMFLVGGTLVLENSFAYPAVILERMQQERVTGFPGVPTMFMLLLQMDLAACDLGSLRYVTNAAAPLSPDTVLALQRQLPQAVLFSMYGQTETARTLYLPPEWVTRKPDSVGIPVPGTEVWVEDPEGRRLGPGQTGELVVRGRHVMRGYWEAPVETAARFRAGALPGERLCYTGDLFRTDEDGFFTFVSRQDDIIKCRGEKVAPREVENVLLSLPGVMQAAVVGIADPVLGQAVKAVLVADRSRVTRANVLAHCRAQLEDFMLPGTVEFRDELPMTPNGKVKRSELI